MGAVRDLLSTLPCGGPREWPRISVVVCSLNGGSTIRDTMEGLTRLDYPNYEVIVIDDGSTDDTAAIAAEYPVRVISTENRGLSSARNTGWQQATGEIVAYIDDDAYPDPDWLRFLVTVFEDSEFVGVGGPNLPPAGDGWIADCVANAPGGPVHVLVTDTEAEHIPGCNMAFRRQALSVIGGFDPVYRAAGDDVDICWRLQERGWTIGFSPVAVVWHHRRNSLKMYWKQQQGYGKAEALLERKWPQRYNTLGHLTWSGRLYGNGLTQAIVPSARIYHGPFGSALFQSVYERSPSGLASLSLMPEWYLLIGFLGSLVLLGSLWAPLLMLWPLLAFACALPIAQAIMSARRARFPRATGSPFARSKRYALTAALHLVQPLARLLGRLNHGLRPWRTRGPSSGAAMFQKHTVWSETWQVPQRVVRSLLSEIRSSGGVVVPGGDFDDWDLEVRGGLFGSVRIRMAVEEHGSGTQLYRFATTPRLSVLTGLGLVMLPGLTVAAAYDGAWAASFAFLIGLCVVCYETLHHLRAAAGTVRMALSDGSFASAAGDQVSG
jgi:glycosyltransferase involved in cell wall biosynthesis